MRSNTPSWQAICAVHQCRPEVGAPSERVARGGVLLDVEQPGWVSGIDPRELRTALGYPGILGVLWPQDNASGDCTTAGLRALRIVDGEQWYGFRPLRGEPAVLLDEAWIAEVVARQAVAR